MSIYFNRYKSVNGICITVGITMPDVSVAETITEEQFLEMLEKFKSREIVFVINSNKDIENINHTKVYR